MRRMRVRFAGQLVGGYLLDRVAVSEHQGRLAALERVVSPEPVLTPEIATLAREVADRYAGTMADVLRLAIPPRHAGAEKAFQGVLPHMQRMLGADHPDTVATRFAIAQEMAARGNHSGAENGFRGMLPQLQRTLGADHPDTLATRFAIAREMAARGDHAGAEEQFRHVLAVGTRTLGAEHPDNLIVRFSIAREMAARGREVTGTACVPVRGRVISR